MKTTIQPELLEDFLKGLHNVVVFGETSSQDDNPYESYEQPSHDLYKLGAEAGENLLVLRASYAKNRL